MAQPQQASESLPGHSFEEHTSEVLVHLSAPTLEQLLVEAGRALAELMSDEPAGPVEGEDAIALEAPDHAALLVQWINELLFLSETRKRIFSRFEVERVGEGAVRARVQGWTPSRLRTQVKAATFHRLSVRSGPEGLRAEVILDV